MSDTNELTPGDRRELRSVVKGRFKVLRAEVARRQAEMRAEIESQLLDRYRAEDQAISDAKRAAEGVMAEAVRQIEEIGRALRGQHPDLKVEAGRDRYTGSISIGATNPLRKQLHQALVAAIPDQVGNAQLSLDRQENDLLQELSVGALQTEQAREFMASIPTVAELVPRARLRELEAQIGGDQ